MDRNTVVGTLLIVTITVLFFIFQSRNQPEVIPESQNQVESSEQQPEQQIQENIIEDQVVYQDSSVLFDSSSLDQTSIRQKKYGNFYKSASGKKEIYTIENEKIKVTLSTKGGIIESVELKDYKTYDGNPLYLVDGERHNRGYVLPQRNGAPVSTSNLYFKAEGSSFQVSGDESAGIKFRLYVNEDQYFEQAYTLSGNSYLLDYDVRFVNMGSILPSNLSYINQYWQAHPEPFEKDLKTERRYSTIYYKFKGDDVENLSLNKSDEEEADNVEWVSFKQHFFNTTLFYKDGFENSNFKVEVNDEDTSEVKYYEATLRLPFRPDIDQSYDMKFYLGPNHYRTLKKTGDDLEELIQLSPDFFLFRWFSIVTKAIIIPMFNLLEKYISSYGIIILILTLIIKMALFPLTFKSYKSAAAMRVLKPEIDALKEKFGDDQQKLGTEQMKLYSQAGVNPLGGCLPMLLQMPILLAMYYFFPSSIELRQESFLWATDLSTYDVIMNLPFTIPMYGNHVSLFTLLMFVSSILYASVQPQMSSGGPGGMQMKYMQYIFPFFLLFLFNSWPAGLTYYYFLSNIITYGQSWAAKKFFINEDKLRERIQENKKKPKKKSKWQKRLEDIQKQQRQVQDKKSKTKQKK